MLILRHQRLRSSFLPAKGHAGLPAAAAVSDVTVDLMQSGNGISADQLKDFEGTSLGTLKHLPQKGASMCTNYMDIIIDI